MLILGGYFESAMGVLFLVMPYALEYMGLPPQIPMFSQMAGCAFISFGYLLVYSAKAIKQYSIIVKMNCIMRFLIQPFVIYNFQFAPALIPILLGAMVYDIAWAIIALYILKTEDLW
jgi:hypothetical protein